MNEASTSSIFALSGGDNVGTLEPVASGAKHGWSMSLCLKKSS